MLNRFLLLELAMNEKNLLSRVTFRQLCEVFQEIGETRGSSSKNELFAQFLAKIDDEVSVELAVRFAAEGAFPKNSGRKCSVGGKTVADAICEYLELDYQMVFKTCRTVLGSASETIEKLLENLEIAHSKYVPKNYVLESILHIYEKIESARKREEKQEILLQIFSELSPLEVKYFLRILSQGSLRIGFEEKSIEQSIASRFSEKVAAVRYAHMLSGDIGKTAVMAMTNNLESVKFELFNPIAFMLASPMESRRIENIEEYVAEEKFDGMRAQFHISSDTTRLFSRDLNEITESFPDLVEQYSAKNASKMVLDGEIIVFRDNQILPFQELQKRMGLKKPSSKMLIEYPAVFIAYDLLFLENRPTVNSSLVERRKLLERICTKYSIPLSTQFSLTNIEDVEQLFEQAQTRGNEGLMLKRKQSTYEFGQRNKSWLKVKRPAGSLDTVIMYAHAGSGKRGGTYSDFTLGIRVDNDDRYEDQFIPIGKAYGGYTNEELKRLGEEIKELTVERFGPTVSLRPNIVVELEFDDIQVNKRTKAKYTLRFPRFRSIRWDLSPNDCDTLRDVEQMFQYRLTRNVEKQKGKESFLID